MEYIKKKIASWEIKYGQIAITGQDYQKAIALFAENIGNSFNIDTHLGIFKNKNFLNEQYRNYLRLSCGPFFKTTSRRGYNFS